MYGSGYTHIIHICAVLALYSFNSSCICDIHVLILAIIIIEKTVTLRKYCFRGYRFDLAFAKSIPSRVNFFLFLKFLMDWMEKKSVKTCLVVEKCTMQGKFNIFGELPFYDTPILKKLFLKLQKKIQDFPKFCSFVYILR